MFVVVFLVESKMHIIVPEKFIFSLDEESLKNVSKNAHFQYKIFWSESCVNSEGVPDIAYPPDFSLENISTFPPANSACYIGKLKRFCCK